MTTFLSVCHCPCVILTLMQSGEESAGLKNSTLWAACAILHDKMSVSETVNLSKNIKEQLPADIIDFIKRAGDAAEKRQQRLYLVGGVVRDLLLERGNLDIDMVVEGDAIKLAQEIAGVNQAKVTAHPRFGTATLKWEKRSADFATARAETYARPGALPTVKPGTIRDDLARRDFSINAMAIELNPRRYGELIDPFGGRHDLNKKLVCVLHDKSFTDDATRIWRALRYEQRLDFRIEPVTLLLIKRDLAMLKTISGDRLRHELELVLKEESPEKALLRADELGVLAKLHPALKGDGWLRDNFAAARERDEKVTPQLYIALLCYRLSAKELEQLIKFLRLPKATAQALRDTLAIKGKMKELIMPGQAPSVIYNLLHGYGTTAFSAVSIGAGSETAAEHIELYLNVLKHVNPTLTGDDLRQLGVPSGPKIKEVLQKLREARLDGKITSKKEEEDWVKGWGESNE
jgi:tRNA nucleotidyltransferase (CCA-adding enzyme)